MSAEDTEKASTSSGDAGIKRMKASEEEDAGIKRMKTSEEGDAGEKRMEMSKDEEDAGAGAGAGADGVLVPIAEDSLRVKKLSEKATLPILGSAGAAGYDLSSAEEATVPARGKAIVKTDISIAIPKGTYARVAPRSGLAAKHSIDVGAGVVDYDYRGNVGVILFNFSDKDFQVKVGDRIAQLILERIMTPPVVEVDELDVTERGAGGFGSTGVEAKK